MKIAYVTPYDFPYPGGVTEHIIGLTAAARRRGYTVDVLAPGSGFAGYLPDGTRQVTRKIISLPVGGSRARISLPPWGYRRVRSILQTGQYDVVHLHEPLTPGVTWLVLHHLRRHPHTAVVATFHAFHERPHCFYRWGRPLLRCLLARLDARIAVSELARQYVSRLFPGPYRVIPNGVDLNRFGPNWAAKFDQNESLRHNRITILFVGRLDYRKGFDSLFQAYEQLKPVYPDLRLRVVGPFDPPETAAYRQKLSAGIEFYGYASPEELPAIYRSADIFCAPSVGSESFGIVLLEAMASGLPVVASDIAGYRAVVSDGVDGVLVPPGQPDALAAALAGLIENPTRRRLMGRQGRQKAIRYSWDRIFTEIEAVYRALIAQKRAGQPGIQPRHQGDDNQQQGESARRVSYV